MTKSAVVSSSCCCWCTKHFKPGPCYYIILITVKCTFCLCMYFLLLLVSGICQKIFVILLLQWQFLSFNFHDCNTGRCCQVWKYCKKNFVFLKFKCLPKQWFHVLLQFTFNTLKKGFVSFKANAKIQFVCLYLLISKLTFLSSPISCLMCNSQTL